VNVLFIYGKKNIYNFLLFKYLFTRHVALLIIFSKYVYGNGLESKQEKKGIIDFKKNVPNTNGQCVVEQSSVFISTPSGL
jgi:hypothetical protein